MQLQTFSSPAPTLANVAWYAVQTSYRCEQRAAKDLTAKGFETYLPLLREVHQWKDRRKAIEVPALSGYLFVRYEPFLRNRICVLETQGVVRLLGSNHAPCPVSEQELDALRRTLNSGLPVDRCDAVLPGAPVIVKRGALAGVHGRVVRIKSNLRLVVSISAISQAVSAELSVNDVEAVSL